MPDIRRIAAALANDDARQVFAEAVLVQPGKRLTEASRRRALAALHNAGLVDDDGAVTGTVFRQLLAEHGRPHAPAGPERFLRNGRIESLPASREALDELLTWIAPRIVGGGERLTEAEMNERLSAVIDDVALLRRHLIDAGVVRRVPSGQAYWLADPREDAP